MYRHANQWFLSNSVTCSKEIAAMPLPVTPVYEVRLGAFAGVGDRIAQGDRSAVSQHARKYIGGLFAGAPPSTGA
jgi:hypothetical protein